MNALVLVGVLLRFRKESIAITCDVEQMFHSFFVEPDNRDFIRFLWFKENNLDGLIVEYRMNVHLFGTMYSPGIANYFKKQWRSELHLLEKFKIDRCLKPAEFGTPVKAEIHSFADACENGLGQVSHIRLVNTHGRWSTCQFSYGKITCRSS